MGFSRVQIRELTNAPCLYGITNGTATASKAVVLDANKDFTGIRNLTLTGTLVAPTQAATDSTFSVVDDGDPTKVFKLQVAGNSTGITTTLATQSTGAATITLPAATSTLATLAGAETLSGKTLTDPIITNITRASAQLDRTDTTLTNIAGLVQTVAVGTYRFRYVLPVTCGGTGGTKTAFKYTTTVVSAINYTSYGYTASAVAVANGTTTTDQATHIASNTAAISIIVEGTMTVSTGGTVQLQFGENSANSTSSVLIGAYMEFTRIA